MALIEWGIYCVDINIAREWLRLSAAVDHKDIKTYSRIVDYCCAFVVLYCLLGNGANHKLYSTINDANPCTETYQ